MNVAEDTYLKVAHSHSWEMATLLPLAAIGQVSEDLEAPKSVGRSEEVVEDQELAAHLNQVEELQEW